MKNPVEKCVEIVNWAVRERGMSVMRFEAECGISGGTISRWMKNERTDVTANTIAKILDKFPQISAEWVMRNEDGQKMFRDGSANNGSAIPENKSLQQHLIDENAFLRKQLDDAQKTIQKMAIIIAESGKVG